jgi:hypothetical protein
MSRYFIVSTFHPMKNRHLYDPAREHIAKVRDSFFLFIKSFWGYRLTDICEKARE